MPIRHAPKPGTRHLLLRNVPADDLRALAIAAASAEPRTTPTELIRGLVHREAERLNNNKRPTGKPAYKFELTVTDIDTLVADDLLRVVTEFVEKYGGYMGGGYAEVDDNGNPLP